MNTGRLPDMQLVRGTKYELHHVCFKSESYCLTVRLLETSAGTASTIFLGLATTRIGNQKVSVVSQKSSPQFVLGTLINIFGVVSDDGLGNGRSDSVDLGSHTSSLDADTDVKVCKLVLSKDKNGLECLQAKGFGLDILNGLSIDLDETTSLLGECASGGGLLPTQKER